MKGSPPISQTRMDLKVISCCLIAPIQVLLDGISFRINGDCTSLILIPRMVPNTYDCLEGFIRIIEHGGVKFMDKVRIVVTRRCS